VGAFIFIRGALRLLLLTLLFIGGNAFAASPACTPPGQVTAATVRYVIDGDTVILTDGRHIRLIGINAMELGHNGAPNQPYAEAARRALLALLSAQHNRIELVLGHQRKDHYGRTLAYLFTAGGRELGAALVRRGLAAAVAIPPNVARIACDLAAERQARVARRGIWSSSSPLVRQAATLSRSARGFHILTGRVTGVSRHGGGMRLTLGGRVWLWVAPKNVHYFDARLGGYRGRRVLVRGWIHGYAGHAEMLLPYPADITGYHQSPRRRSRQK
jgi:endonuclease YncB( thermonuclease family)